MLAYSSNVGTITDRRPARPGPADRLPAAVRAGQAHRRGHARRGARPAAAGRRVERVVVRVGADRAQRRRHAAADGRRVRRHRQRRHLRAAAPGQGDDRPGRQAHPRAARRSPARCSARRTPRRCAPCWRRSPPSRAPPAPGAAVPGYRVAGKTGTGWRLVDGKKQPGEVASFIGMAPGREAPVRDRGLRVRPGGGGGAVAGPAFREMMQLHAASLPGAAVQQRSRPKFVVYPR